ncbi:MAG: YIP1 family protein [bacterium]
MNGSEKILNFIISPTESILSMEDRKYYPSSFATILLAVFSLVLSINIITGRGLTVSMLLTRFSIMFLCALSIWIACASLYHFSAEITGGQGNVITLLSLIGFSTAPMLLLAPLSLLIMLVGNYTGILYGIVLCGMCIWVLMLMLRSLSLHYSLNHLIAACIVGAPLYIVPLLMLLMILLLILISKISGSLKIVSSFIT